MATKFATAYVDVDANLAPMRRSLSGIGKLGLIAGGAIAAGIAVEIKKSVQAFTETEKVAKQTNAVLKSTGRAAGVSAKQIGVLATAISKKSGIDDEAVQSAENLLLTFTNVRNEAGKGNKIFSQATSVIADMSVALGQDMKSSSIQLGKALNDPIKGITALRRVGVSFTKQQQDQIKTMVESGNTLDAQKLILRELNKEFGGSAAAQAQPLDKLKVSIGNIQEAIGSGFKPAVDGVADTLTNLADKVLPHVQDAADEVGRIFSRDDLDLGEKFNRAFAATKIELAPLADQLARAARGQQFGSKVEDAIAELTPHIAEGFAHAAPRAASAFLRAWGNMDVGGQLIAALYLSKKLGIFTLFGRRAGKSMIGGMAESSGAASVLGARWGGLLAAGIRGVGWAAVGAYIIDKLGIGKWITDHFGKDVEKFFGFNPDTTDATAHGHHNQTQGERRRQLRDAERRRRRRELEIQNPVGPPGNSPILVHPHHRRRRRRPPRTSGGAVAHLSSVTEPAMARMAAFTPEPQIVGPLRGVRELTPKIARQFQDDNLLATAFDDAFVNRTGLRNAIYDARYHPRPHHRHRRLHPVGTGGIQAPIHNTRNVEISVPVTQVNRTADARTIGVRIARELDRRG